MLWLIWSLALLAALILYLRNIYSKFEKQGVKTDRVVPVLGSMGTVILRTEHVAENFQKTYFKFPEERFVGRFEFTKPVLLIRDLELIKKITIKDKDHFLDHRVSINSDSDPFFARTLFSLKGQEWKDMRPNISPAFTSSKMRLMVPFMVDVGDQMIHNLKNNIKECGSSYLDVEVKDLMTRYACDVIATCAFGLKVDSQIDRNNLFYTQGLLASSFKFKHLVIFSLSAACPWLMNALNLKLFSTETQNFFKNLVLSTMQEREKNEIIRPDMIHLLIEAKKGKLTFDEKTQDADAGFATVEESTVGQKPTMVADKVWKDVDLVAQALVFFVAGFDTVASSMSWLLYELALNPDVQEKLVLEINEMHDKNKGKLDYNAVEQMKYMDMVVSEILRKYTAGIVLDRMCTKDYNLGKPNDKATKDYIIRKGDGLHIPVWAIHRDPQYYPDPDKFNPERFSDENKHNIKPFTYMPFGMGPRNCIASRFALFEVKVMAYQLLRQMEVFPCPRTTIPVQLDVNTFSVNMKGGLWLRFKVRD